MAFVPTNDKRNRENLDKLAPNTKVAAYDFYQFCLDNKIDILIYETIRTLEQQKKYLADGKSTTLKSYHLTGQALDFVPVVKGEIKWDGYKTANIMKAVAYAKSIGFTWGGDWKTFVDCPHLQFNYKGYGTDLKLDTQAQVQDGKQYRIQTGTWEKTPEQINHLEQIEGIFARDYVKVIYREDEGGRYRIKTGTFSNKKAAEDTAKEIQTKYKILCYVIEA